jgi:hypothetical protein
MQSTPSEPERDTTPPSRDWEEGLRRLLSWTSVIAVIGYGIVLFVLFLIGGFRDPQMTALVLKHYPTVVGLPSAAAAALFIVLVLKAAAGPIEFEGLGFKFRGASGPVVLWVFCFLAIVAAIRTVWELTYKP